MYPTPDRFMILGKSSIEAALTVANITLQSTGRLLDLNLRTAKEALDESVRSAKTLAEAKNVQELVALQSNAAQPGIDKAVSYSRSVYEVATEAQSELGRLFETQMAQVSEEVASVLDKAAKTAPAGSEPAFAALRSAMAMANNAYDTFTKAARQATDSPVNNVAQAPAEAASTSRKKTH